MGLWIHSARQIHNLAQTGFNWREPLKKKSSGFFISRRETGRNGIGPSPLPAVCEPSDDKRFRNSHARSFQGGNPTLRLRRHDRKGVETILAALLLVVIVVVTSLIVFTWSLGFFGAILPPPPGGKEILVVENQAYNNANNNMTLYIRNTGTALTTLIGYYVQDLNGNQCAKTSSWTVGPIAPTQLGKAYLALPSPPSNYCAWTGTPFNYQPGNSYTVTVVTSRNNQFSFTILR